MSEPQWVRLTAEDLAHRWRERTTLDYLNEMAVGIDAGVAEYCDPETALRWMLKLTWDDLAESQRLALNGRWSIRCEGLVWRIVGMTRLVGPTPWQAVSVDLILSGVYERVHELAGSPTPLSDADRTRAQEVLERRSR